MASKNTISELENRIIENAKNDLLQGVTGMIRNANTNIQIAIKDVLEKAKEQNIIPQVNIPQGEPHRLKIDIDIDFSKIQEKADFRSRAINRYVKAIKKSLPPEEKTKKETGATDASNDLQTG